MLRKIHTGRHGESGQALVTFALMITVMMAMLALVLDLGLLFGQRRFDQNGADAAALKVGHMLAGSVSPRENPDSLDDVVPVYFGWSESDVYTEARRYAGLRPSDTASALPTGLNQNMGLTNRNRLDMTLEFWNTEDHPDAWCYSPSGPAPTRSPSVPVCTRFRTALVPAPADNGDPFKVRVTVSSTTVGFFVNAAALTCGLDEACKQQWINGTPPPPTSQAVPACSRPRVAGGGAWGPDDDVTGNTTCAHAVVTIRGSTSPQYQGPGGVVPISTGWCQLTGDGTDPFIVLWGGGGQTDDCDFKLNGYANILDLTDRRKWCNGTSPDYEFVKLMPSDALGDKCPTSYTPDWNGGGAAFVPDPEHPGNNDRDDMVYWTAVGFKGEVAAGNWLPTYCNLKSVNCSTTGNNVADAFYGGNFTGTYFFSSDKPGFHAVCPDRYGEQYDVGCRDVGVPIWAVAQVANKNGDGWEPSGGAPDRVQIWQVLNFRLYCEHTGDSNTPCTDRPSFLSNSNSRVYGRFVSSVITDPCPDCNGGPSLNGNEAVLGD
jgi:hypothetical protein